MNLIKVMALITSLSFTSLISYAAPKLSEVNLNISLDNKHVLIFIHGLRGNDTTFGELPKRMKDFIKTKKGIDVPTPLIVLYDTANPDKSPEQFAKELTEQMIKYYNDNQLDPKTPYSFLVHSQGGIVAQTFLKNCLRIKGDLCDKGEGNIIPDEARYIVEMGTPNHGSPVANRLHTNKLLKKYSGSDAISGEIKQLSIGSDRLTNNQRFFISQHKKIIEAEKKAKETGKEVEYVSIYQKVKIVTIAGNIKESFGGFVRRKLGILAPIFNKLGLLNFINYEIDVVVPTSSARLDLNYYIESYDENNVLVKERDTTELVDRHFIVDFPHLPLPVKIYNHDIAQVKAEHTKENNVILRIVEAIFDTLNSGEKLSEMVVSGQTDIPTVEFMSEIRMEFPKLTRHKPQLFSKKDAKKMITINANNKVKKLSYKNSIVFKYNGFESSDFIGKVVDDQGVKRRLNNKKALTYYHIGAFKDEDAYTFQSGDVNATRLGYEVDFPGWKVKKFAVKVAPSFISYAELQMELDTVFENLLGNKKEQLVSTDDNDTMGKVVGVSKKRDSVFVRDYNTFAINEVSIDIAKRVVDNETFVVTKDYQCIKARTPELKDDYSSIEFFGSIEDAQNNKPIAVIKKKEDINDHQKKSNKVKKIDSLKLELIGRTSVVGTLDPRDAGKSQKELYLVSKKSVLWALKDNFDARKSIKSLNQNYVLIDIYDVFVTDKTKTCK